MGMKGISLLIIVVIFVAAIGGMFFLYQNIFQKFQLNNVPPMKYDQNNYPQQILGYNQSQAPSKNYHGQEYSNVPSCGEKNILFSFLPVDMSQVITLTPVGQRSTPDHVFPAPHEYFNVIDWNNPSDKEVNVYAPGDMTLTQIGLRHYNKLGQATNYIDYTLLFTVCDKFYFYYHHVRSLKYQPFIDAAQKTLQTCHFKSEVNEDYCSGQVNIPVKAGELVGTTGDLKAGVYGLDMGARDLRLPNGKNFANPNRFCSGNFINPFDRCYTVCAFDYFPKDVTKQLQFMDSEKNIRTDPPVCGDLYNDIKDAAQGYWFKQGPKLTNFSPESDNLFLGPDFIKPSIKLFSIGLSVPSLSAGSYTFGIKNSGLVNRDFKDVTSDGKIYCYDTSISSGGSLQNSLGEVSIILQLTSKTTMRLEKLGSGTCGSGPWSFGSNFVDFER